MPGKRRARPPKSCRRPSPSRRKIPTLTQTAFAFVHPVSLPKKLSQTAPKTPGCAAAPSHTLQESAVPSGYFVGLDGTHQTAAVQRMEDPLPRHARSDIPLAPESFRDVSEFQEKRPIRFSPARALLGGAIHRSRVPNSRDSLEVRRVTVCCRAERNALPRLYAHFAATSRRRE